MGGSLPAWARSPVHSLISATFHVRLDESIQSLRRAGILSPIEFEELMGAYQFLRRLINAQRVLRGSAQDLFLPARSSDELLHLARRMNYVPEENNAAEIRPINGYSESGQGFGWPFPASLVLSPLERNAGRRASPIGHNFSWFLA